MKLSERLEAAVERLYEDGMDTRGIADLLRESAELARRVEGAAKIDMPSRIGPRTDGARLVITDKAAERLGIDGRTCRLVPEDDHESKLYP